MSTDAKDGAQGKNYLNAYKVLGATQVVISVSPVLIILKHPCKQVAGVSDLAVIVNNNILSARV